MRLAFLALAYLSLAGCQWPHTANADAHPAPLASLPGQEIVAPLPMRIPIRGVMAGIIDFSAHGVFKTAMSEMPLAGDDWAAAGLASINLIGSATLITSPGAGPNDEAWVAEPEWREWAAAYQQASVNAAIAIRRKDRADLLTAANDLANACQSCHDRFRVADPRSRSQYAEQMTPRSLREFSRAWPQPAS